MDSPGFCFLLRVGPAFVFLLYSNYILIIIIFLLSRPEMSRRILFDILMILLLLFVFNVFTSATREWHVKLLPMENILLRQTQFQKHRIDHVYLYITHTDMCFFFLKKKNKMLVGSANENIRYK